MNDFISKIKSLNETIFEVGLEGTSHSAPMPRMTVAASETRHVSLSANFFSSLVTEQEITSVTRDLFVSGHYQHAVTEAFKALEKYVQATSGSTDSGTKLMATVFSPTNPVIKLNKLLSQSERDEQDGYQKLFMGSMLGIRNPCTHEFHWVEDEGLAFELIMFAQHLLRKAKASNPQPPATSPPAE